MIKDLRIALRIDSETHAMLRELSVAEERSMSAVIRFLIRREHKWSGGVDKMPEPYRAYFNYVRKTRSSE